MSEHIRSAVFKGESPLLGHYDAAGKGGDVLKHLLPSVAEARSLDGRNLERAAELVHNEGRKSLTINILGNNQK